MALLPRIGSVTVCGLFLALGAAAFEVELTPILRPRLDAMDPPVQELLTSQMGRLDELLAAADTTAAELEEAFAELGKLYMVYSLEDAAASCFVNAHRLAPHRFDWPYLLGAIEQDAAEFEEAATLLQTALDLRPGDSPTTLRLADVAFELEQAERASELYRSLIDQEGYRAAAQYGLGRVAAADGDFKTAIEHFEKAAADQPDASEVAYQLGLAYREIGDRDRARTFLSRPRGTELASPDPLIQGLGTGVAGSAIYITTGNQFRHSGDYPQAVAAYRKAIEEDPQNVAYRRVLASTLVDAGHTPAAIAEYNAILAMDSNDINALYNLGTLLSRQDRVEEGIGYLRRAVEVAPDHTDARVNLAEILADSGDLSGAESLFSEAISIDPYDLELRISRASLWIRQDRASAAAREAESILIEDPNNVEAQLVLGDAQQAMGDSAAAVESYRQALEKASQPEHLARGHFELGSLRLQTGQTDEAIEQLRLAADAAPDAGAIRLTLARALGSQGDLAGAADQFAEAIRIEPRSEEAWFGRSISLLLGGRDAEARLQLELSQQSLPQSLPLKHLLARLLAASEDATVRDGTTALTLAREVFQAQQNLDHAETLAMAFAEAGDFQQAIVWQSEIIDRARSAGQMQRLPRLQERLDSYQQGEPCRAPWRNSS